MSAPSLCVTLALFSVLLKVSLSSGGGGGLLEMYARLQVDELTARWENLVGKGLFGHNFKAKLQEGSTAGDEEIHKRRKSILDRLRFMMEVDGVMSVLRDMPKMKDKQEKIAIFSGVGRNGTTGLLIAEQLVARGYKRVHVVTLPRVKTAEVGSKEHAENVEKDKRYFGFLERLKALSYFHSDSQFKIIEMHETGGLQQKWTEEEIYTENYAVFIEAFLGAGYKPELNKKLADANVDGVIGTMKNGKKCKVYTISIDLPCLWTQESGHYYYHDLKEFAREGEADEEATEGEGSGLNKNELEKQARKDANVLPLVHYIPDALIALSVPRPALLSMEELDGKYSYQLEGVKIFITLLPEMSKCYDDTAADHRFPFPGEKYNGVVQTFESPFLRISSDKKYLSVDLPSDVFDKLDDDYRGLLEREDRRDMTGANMSKTEGKKEVANNPLPAENLPAKPKANLKKSFLADLQPMTYETALRTRREKNELERKREEEEQDEENNTEAIDDNPATSAEEAGGESKVGEKSHRNGAKNSSSQKGGENSTKGDEKGGDILSSQNGAKHVGEGNGNGAENVAGGDKLEPPTSTSSTESEKLKKPIKGENVQRQGKKKGGREKKIVKEKNKKGKGKKLNKRRRQNSEDGPVVGQQNLQVQLVVNGETNIRDY